MCQKIELEITISAIIRCFLCRYSFQATIRIYKKTVIVYQVHLVLLSLIQNAGKLVDDIAACCDVVADSAECHCGCFDFIACVVHCVPRL